MFDSKLTFKLRLCSEPVDQTKPHWVLENVLVNLKDIDQIDLVNQPFEYFIIMNDVINELNTNDPFEFPYHPKQKDTLSLCFDSHHFNLVYTNGKWKDFSTYVGLRDNQKEFKQEGEIVIP